MCVTKRAAELFGEACGLVCEPADNGGRPERRLRVATHDAALGHSNHELRVSIINRVIVKVEPIDLGANGRKVCDGSGLTYSQPSTHS
jgi:hypothetical protein